MSNPEHLSTVVWCSAGIIPFDCWQLDYKEEDARNNNYKETTTWENETIAESQSSTEVPS